MSQEPHNPYHKSLDEHKAKLLLKQLNGKGKDQGSAKEPAPGAEDYPGSTAIFEQLQAKQAQIVQLQQHNAWQAQQLKQQILADLEVKIAQGSALRSCDLTFLKECGKLDL